MNRAQPRRRPGHERGRSAARAAAMSTIRAAIERAAVEYSGGTARQEPNEGAEVSGAALDDAVFDAAAAHGLVGVGAARLALEVAGKLLRDYALDARAVGASWDDIAAALELPENTDGAEIGDGPGAPRGETAFEWLIEGQQPPRPHESREQSWQRSMASWRCGTCRNRVIDRGPFGSHPDDREYGHGADCSRRAAALVQWAREFDDGHEHTDEQDEHEQENERAKQGENNGGGGPR